MLRTAIALALAAALGLTAAGPAAACADPPQPPLPRGELTLETLRGAFEYAVELATTPEQKACGLMERPRLGREEGMLFRIDPPGPTYFWMRNTPQPLDMLFVDRQGRVVHIAEHTTPYSSRVYGTDLAVAAVLEVRAGTAARLAVELGDHVRHSWFEGN